MAVGNRSGAVAAALLAVSFIAVANPRPWRVAGWSIPALLVLMIFPVFGEESAVFPWGGFVALGLGVIAIQYAVTRPVWLESRALVWLGKISYGLYLWH